MKKVEYGYGYFTGGDPRKFYPDLDACSIEEINNHKAACQLWDEAESRGETPTPEDCPSGWLVDNNGKKIMHVLCAPYGIGGYEIEIEDGDTN